MRPTVLLAVIALPLAAASIQATKPEEVGLSSERLNRIHEAVQRHIDDHDVSGAATLVARKGPGCAHRIIGGAERRLAEVGLTPSTLREAATFEVEISGKLEQERSVNHRTAVRPRWYRGRRG